MYIEDCVRLTLPNPIIKSALHCMCAGHSKVGRKESSVKTLSSPPSNFDYHIKYYVDILCRLNPQKRNHPGVKPS